MVRRVSLFLTLVVVLSFAAFNFAPSSVASAVTAPPRIRVKNGASTNWSGYGVESNLSAPARNYFSEVSGQWVVPAVTCTATAYAAIWVGLDGFSDNTVEQLGTDSDCRGTTPAYFAWFEMYPQYPYTISSVPVQPGNTIYTDVKFVGSGNFTLTLKNLTTGRSFSTTQRLVSAVRSSAEWVVEAPWSGSVLPLANFHTVSITNAKAVGNNGHSGGISDSSWKNEFINMVSNDGSHNKDTVSGIGSGGTSFSVTWNSSN